MKLSGKLRLRLVEGAGMSRKVRRGRDEPSRWELGENGGGDGIETGILW